jgi:uncharacterized protein (DUF433 family)
MKTFFVEDGTTISRVTVTSDTVVADLKQNQVIIDDFDFVNLVDDNENITRDPSIRGGFPVFRGTRVPADMIFDFLETGKTIDDFLKTHDYLTRDKVISVLKLARYAFIRGAE